MDSYYIYDEQKYNAGYMKMTSVLVNVCEEDASDTSSPGGLW